MALVVEDGSIVESANSYISLADARAYALDRGVVLSAVDADLTAILVKAADYVDSFRAQYMGTKVSGDQTMQWPRTGVSVEGFAIDSTAIPALLQAAQVEAAIAITNGADLRPVGNAAPVYMEKVGPLETRYDTRGGRSTLVPRVTAVESLLRPLFRFGGKMRPVRA